MRRLLRLCTFILVILVLFFTADLRSQEKEKPVEMTLEVGTKEDAERAMKVARRFLELAQAKKITDAAAQVEERYRQKVHDEFEMGKLNRLKLKSINRIALFDSNRGWRARLKATVESDQEIGIDMIFLQNRWWITVQ